MDTLKKGYVINNTLDLSSRVMSLDAAKDIMLHCTTVSGKTLSFSTNTWGLILSDDDAIEILEGIYSKGWSTNEPDIQVTADSGYNGVVMVNSADIQLTQVGSTGFWYGNAPSSVTSLSYFMKHANVEYYNSTSVYIRKFRVGKGFYAKTSGLTTMWYAFSCGGNSDSSRLDSIDVRHINTSSVTNLTSSFNRCGRNNPEGITIKGIEDWNTSSVTVATNMFNLCRLKVPVLDLHKWHIPSASADLGGMFGNSIEVADDGINICYYYTPGYWGKDYMSAYDVTHVKPVVYPYHDINVAAASGFNGQMYKDTALVNMTKDNTLGIWYYDFSSSYTFTTNSVRSLFRNSVNSTVTANLYSVSFKKDAFSRADDASLDTYGMFMGCRALRSFDVEALSNKMTTGAYQMWNMGTASSSSLTIMHLPEFTQNYGYSATFQYCNSIRYAKFPTIKNASGYFASVFSGCTRLRRITNMPGIANGANTSNAFSGCSALTTIDACGPISETIDISAAPLNLNSAKVILRQLQTVTSETFTFSSTTLGYINNDNEAMTLVQSARNRGWNIPGASSLPGISGTVSSGSTFTFTLNSEAVTVPVSNGSWVYNIPSSTHVYNINFVNSTVLTSLDLSQLDTSEITNFSNMFEGCSNLTSLDLRTFDTSGAYYFNDMFNGCTKLTSVNLSGWDTSNSTHWMRMFKDCTSLRNIDISHFDATYTQNITGMFQGCTNITIAIANSNNAIDMRNITTYNNFIENIGTVTVRYSSNVRVYNSFIKADFPRANWVDVG